MSFQYVFRFNLKLAVFHSNKPLRLEPLVQSCETEQVLEELFLSYGALLIASELKPSGGPV
tara:strand:- start:33 stop:215 length:183 start_codon:yes stop_codon:yes gene_type:complete